MKNQEINKLHNESFFACAKKDICKYWTVYIMAIPMLIFFILFSYRPMVGLVIAFKNFSVRKGIWDSAWCGFDNFRRFFKDPFFLRNIVNTFRISISSIIFGFPAPILFALLVNELNSKKFAKSIQTITYLPHFISLVVICGMIQTFVSSSGIITRLVEIISGNDIKESLLNNTKNFVPIYVLSDIWQQIGWSSIIYTAAIAGVPQELYEASSIDGAGRLRQVLNVTLPAILPTIILMLILKLGGILNVGYEKIILLNNPFNADVSEVLSYYVYQKGIQNNDFGLSTAAGLFNSVINMIFVIGANVISKRSIGSGLW